ncbi:ABC transporter ATP-binding protein [Weissella koreensis]|uniref:ABC transporter ATP-binding protein n=1 Tax=Weissella koreensis TaxID=165096 RepID=A0A7H1MKM6_9LACO|nr:ABC transporter ATP-binding protein [Weissella koreensis]AEJ23165.1 antimicrobial peptide ABC transporter ATPase [Weissella koreensis KACC 15510]AVH74809.1 ABC transporter ATP-binding protein [Weissella koreensis]EJF33766.1 antimicrobial peptide ABC transporter ATPase [Weissella koreensis KCTC 3621]MCZ9310670.1 ABC transporter ATP-binding protein [Weissella koreensis]QGN20033.1 ATP-binding cassette domain-containing protein [Weissella koreensis]
MNILNVKNVSKIYGKKGEKSYEALKNLSFSMEKGEFIAIMGASGSGKSTLLNSISTLDTPTSGEIVIDGESIANLSGHKLAQFRSQKIGFIFQEFNLLENLTVAENIALPLSLQGTSAGKIKVAVQHVAKLLRIENLLSSYPEEISGGQKQRTAAARALVHNPSIILGDEPTGALDSKNAHSLLDTMQEMNQQQDVSILMVTHDAMSASYANRVLFIQDGQVYQELVKGQEESNESFYQDVLKVVSQLQ